MRCFETDRDRYGRIVAECFFNHPEHGAVNVNATMVVRGDAVAYRKYSTDYVDQEHKARAEQRGIWAGSFTLPWKWRRQHK